ncbi:bifunctional DNA-binding transcriptional regulator/O6-methylguanine-DNA methyltransferase Ada [Methylobacterium frigidaeris]|nr:bifunctional DNA-binding transcriptional regulator/O6-methylguanine-DNA methyltransferase Ada [Methylobacterium frigidaeris]PIK74126.1 bifunctional DNA-binding transcriptional regulator/O6-methylguanine-DNA methyltransferase Ada [Methylobacterium frigidaeris]
MGGVPPLDTAACFAAIARRDRAADGRFVYAVRSTGVYCRPSCAARPALPKNVSFHPTCAAAEEAGFRACRRCRPNEASLGERQTEAVARACRMIDAAETPPALADLAATAGLSPYHFHRVFKQVTGVTPRAYGAARRAARAAEGLRQAGTVTEAIFDAGYGAASRFYAAAPTRLGMTPTAYRRGGEGAAIRFAVGACSLGHVLVAATETGLCAILLGDDPDALLRDLQDRFPKAVLTGGDRDFEAVVAQVVGLVEAPGMSSTLPLDIGGTAFQQRVWQALRAIPPGRTATYAEIAQAIGAPSAARAVALACGANALAVAIPCHRVVRQDGSLSGYRWGVARKRALLDRERADST